MMQNMIVNEFLNNIRSKLFTKTKEADKIIEDMIEDVTQTFRNKLRYEVYSNLNLIVNEEMNKLEIESTTDYTNSNNTITIKVLKED